MKRLIGLLLAVSSGVFGADNYWDGSTGSWADGPRWSLGRAPGGNTDYAHITGGTARIASSPAGTVERLYMGGSSGANLEISADAQFKDLYLGEAGKTATISQTGGNVTLSGNYTTHIGRYDTATYNLSGGTLTHNSTSGADTHTFIGVYGGANGIFNQTGGTFIKNGSIQQNIIVGYANGAKGTVNLSGGQFLHQVGDLFVLGALAGSEGRLNVSGTARFQIGDGVGAGSAQPSTGYAILQVGDEGYGEVNQTGGSVDALYLKIADSTTTGAGRYTISGGSLDIHRYIYLVNKGKAVFEVSGSGADHIRTDRFLLNGNTLVARLDASGVTPIEVVGTSSDPYHDAWVNGRLEVGTLPGFSATPGDTFDVLNSATRLVYSSWLYAVNQGPHEFDFQIAAVSGKPTVQLVYEGESLYPVHWNGTGGWMDAGKWTDPSNNWNIPGWVDGNPGNTGGSSDPDWNRAEAHLESGTNNLSGSSFPDGTVARLLVGSSNAVAVLNIATNLTVRDNMQMGAGSQPGCRAVVNQTGGTLLVEGGKGFGYFGRGGGSGAYNLSGGVFDARGAIPYSFGSDGVSDFVFTQTGGTYTNSGTGGLVLGRSPGATGTVEVVDGTFAHTASETVVGQGGVGEFVQRGGTVLLGKLSLGRHGRYSVSGGTLRLASYLHGDGGCFEVDGSGAGLIEMPSFYFYGNTLRARLDAGGVATVRVTGGTKVDLRSAILEVGTLPGFAGKPGDTYDLVWSASGFMTTGMQLFRLDDAADFGWGIVDKDGGQVLRLTVKGSPLQMWTLGYGLEGADAEATADPDKDGYDNQSEFALGGDPTNAAFHGHAASLEAAADSALLYVYPRRSDADESQLSYYLELCTNLVEGGWSNTGYSVTGVGTIDEAFSAVTNRIPTAGKQQGFVQLMTDGVLDLEVVEYNILGVDTPGYADWDARRPWIAEALTNAAPDIIGLEEIRYRDIADYLQSALGDGGYTAFPASNLGIQVRGTPDTVLPDGLQGRHWQNVLYYKTSLFDEVDGGQQVLHEGDNIEFFSQRSITWVRLRHRQTGRELVAIATHLDPHDSLRRENATADLKDFILSFPSNLPVVLVGDFNAQPGSSEVQTLVGDGTMKSVIERSSHIDYIMQRNFLERGGNMYNYQEHDGMPLSDHPMLTAFLALEKASTGN